MYKRYDNASYAAYGDGADIPFIGFLEGGCLRSKVGVLLFTVNGVEVFSPDGSFAGYIDYGEARSPDGQLLFRLEESWVV